MGPRAGFSTVLLAGALVLVAAIAVGNNMGNRVLGQVASRTENAPGTPLPTALASAADNPAARALWKRRQVLSVATDPAFPDPRITPEPPPPETPHPVRVVRQATPSPSPSPSPSSAGVTSSGTYTSPPLLIPMKSHVHDGDASASPEEASPAAAPHASPSASAPP